MAEKKSTKFCMACGAKISADSRFCEKCGDDTENSRVNKLVQSNTQNNKGLPAWAIVLIVIGAIVFYGIVFGEDTEIEGGGTLTNTEEKTETSSKKEETIEYIKVTKDDLDEALEKNAANAKDTYKGKYLEISGKLGTIDSDLKYIGLRSLNNEWDFNEIKCDLVNKEQKNIVKSLSKGQDIVVRGKITDVGEILGYYLDVIEIYSAE